MKIFISWSGALSRELGEILREWLPNTIQAIKPYFTPSDVEKGARWQSEIAAELESSSVAILCLTHESLNSPWVLFEAGALSKSANSARVCPLLFGPKLSDLPGPLAQFQAAVFSRNEVFKILKTVNSLLKDHALTEKVLSNVFEKWWPDLDQKVQKAISHHKTAPIPTTRDTHETLGEILELARLLAHQNANAPTVRLAKKTPIETYTLGTVPSPNSNPGKFIIVVDLPDGPSLCYSAGGSWQAIEAHPVDQSRAYSK